MITRNEVALSVNPPALYNDQRLKLGLFGLNCGGGLTMTDPAINHRLSWESNLKPVQIADRLGMEIVVPVARWRGFAGRDNFNGSSFETFTWAAALAASTSQIMLATTAHLPTVHPIVAAKQAATIDHISNGRFALNLVMGWFNPEMEMFGADQRGHADRYKYGSEWVEIVDRLWSELKGFDFEGEYIQVRDAVSLPKPVQLKPILINAGNSPAGLEFSARYVDFNFASLNTLEDGALYSKLVRQKARDDWSREIGVMTYAMVICRDTEEEAERVRSAILEAGDYEGAENLMSVLGVQSSSFNDQIKAFRERFVLGWGGYPLVGTPEQVADGLLSISNAGMDGVILGFLNYESDLIHFGEKVMPLLRQAGLRS